MQCTKFELPSALQLILPLSVYHTVCMLYPAVFDVIVSPQVLSEKSRRGRLFAQRGSHDCCSPRLATLIINGYLT